MLALSRLGENRKIPLANLANAVGIDDQMLDDGRVTRRSHIWLTTEVEEEPFRNVLPNLLTKDLGRFADIRLITTVHKVISNIS